MEDGMPGYAYLTVWHRGSKKGVFLRLKRYIYKAFYFIWNFNKAILACASNDVVVLVKTIKTPFKCLSRIVLEENCT
jgi:hypothetical protein